MRKAKLGSDHPDTLTSMHNLAYGYEGLGRRHEALQLREQTLQLMKSKLGPDHPHTLACMHSLAYSYAQLNRQGEALKLFKEFAASGNQVGPRPPRHAEVHVGHCGLPRQN